MFTPEDDLGSLSGDATEAPLGAPSPEVPPIDESVDDIPDSTEAIKVRSTDSTSTEPKETEDMSEEVVRREAAANAHSTVLEWATRYENEVASVSPNFNLVRESRNLILHLRAVLDPSVNSPDVQRWRNDTTPHVVVRLVVEAFRRCFPDSMPVQPPEWFDKFKRLEQLPTVELTSVLVETLNFASKKYTGSVEDGSWCEPDASSLRFNVPRPSTLESLGPLLKTERTRFSMMIIAASPE